MGTRRRWTATALVPLAAQVGILAWVELAFGISALLHEALLNGASVAVGALGALVPSGFGVSLAVLATYLGLGWLYNHLVAPSFAGGAGLSTVGGALVAPVYLGVRRLFFDDREREVRADDPAPREEPMAKAFEPMPRASTAVQESL